MRIFLIHVDARCVVIPRARIFSRMNRKSCHPVFFDCEEGKANQRGWAASMAYGIELLSGDRVIAGVFSGEWWAVRRLAERWSPRGRQVDHGLVVRDEKGILLRLGGECGWVVPPEPAFA